MMPSRQMSLSNGGQKAAKEKEKEQKQKKGEEATSLK